MKLIRLLAGTLVSSALFSSSTTMADFPMPDSVQAFYKNFPCRAKVLTDGFRKTITEEIPSLKCTVGDEKFSDCSSFIGECESRGYGKLPFAIKKFENGNFKVLKFEDVQPKAKMVFERISSSKGVCYRLNGVGEYGNGLKDDYEEIRALADFLIQKYFSKLYFNELNTVERDLFFYILAERVEDCTDVYGD